MVHPPAPREQPAITPAGARTPTAAEDGGKLKDDVRALAAADPATQQPRVSAAEQRARRLAATPAGRAELARSLAQVRGGNEAGYRRLVEHLRTTRPDSPLTRALVAELPPAAPLRSERDVVVPQGGPERNRDTVEPTPRPLPDRPNVVPDGRGGPRPVEPVRAPTADDERTAAVRRGEAYLAAFRDGSMRVTQALLNDPVVAFNPGDVGSGRVREADAVNASLRLNTAVWTVQRDLRANTLTPQAFNRQSWAEVTPRDMHDLAVRRLDEGGRDWRSEANAMVADRTLQPLRVHVRGQSEPLTLTHDNINTWGWIMDRSPESLVAPNRAARILAGMAPMTSVRDGAANIAAATTDEARLRAFAASTLGTAETLAGGSDSAAGQRRQLAPNSSVLSSGLAVATQTFFRVEDVPAGTTADSLRNDRTIQHLVIGRNPDGTPRVRVARLIENTEQLGREVQRRLAEGELDWLDPATRARVEVLSRDGARHIRDRETDEASSRWWRELGGTITETAALTVATAGIGTLFAGGVRATTGSIALARAAYVGGQSLSFTALSQATSGHFDPLQYPIDLAMFGALSRTNAIAQRLAGVGLGGTAVRQTMAHLSAFAMTNVAGSTAGTGITALREAWQTGGVDWQARLNQFGMSLIAGTVIHGTNSALNRFAPRLTVDGVVIRERERLLGEARQQSERLPQIVSRYEAAEAEAGRLRAQGVEPGDPRLQAVARRATEAIDEYNALFTASRATQAAFRGLVARYAPSDLPELDRLLERTGRAPGEVRADPGEAPAPARRAQVEDQVEDSGSISGLLDVGIPPGQARAAAADRPELLLRYERIRRAYGDLVHRAEAGDPVAQRRIEEFRATADRLTMIREDQSSTATVQPEARRNIREMDRLTRHWLRNDRDFMTPDEVVLRVRQLNHLATHGLDIHGMQIGTNGEIRGDGMNVGAGSNSYPAGGAPVRQALRDFAQWYARGEREVAAGRMTPVELAARSYQTLVSIHPFLDGNGRTTRAFMDWVLQRHGLPPATLAGRERNVAYFTGPSNGGAQRVTPDEAVAVISRSVNRTLTELEQALYGPLPQRPSPGRTP